MTVGQLLKHYRESAGMSQKELARALGVSYVNISQIENNRRMPRSETVKRIAEALGSGGAEFLRHVAVIDMQEYEKKQREEAIEKAARYERKLGEDFQLGTVDFMRTKEDAFMMYGTTDMAKAHEIAEMEDDIVRKAMEEALKPGEREHDDVLYVKGIYDEFRKRVNEECETIKKAIRSLPVGKYRVALIFVERAKSRSPLGTDGEPTLDAAKMERYLTADAAELSLGEIEELLRYMDEVIFRMSFGYEPLESEWTEVYGFLKKLLEDAFGKGICENAGS
jgi:transcriptional regulator with XRE-family HTH domain